jgi:PEP-CTERM motif
VFYEGRIIPRMHKQVISKWKVLALAAVVLLIYGPVARADSVVLTFEGVGNAQEIGNFYNVGAGGGLGISFTGVSVALISSLDGGSGNFANAPSGDTAAIFLAAAMNVPAGFTSLSFFYSNASNPSSVSVWSGLNGTGALLGTLDLPTNGICFPPPNYCVWTEVGMNFSGTAESLLFPSDATKSAFFVDNVTLTPAPEPATLLLLVVGSLGLTGLRRRAV